MTPVIWALQKHVINGQCLTAMVAIRYRFGGLGMASSKSDNYHLQLMLQILHWTVKVDWCNGSVTIAKWYKICHHSIWRELNLAVTNSSYAYSRNWFTCYCIVYNIVIEYIQLCYISNTVMCPSSVHINHLLMLISTTSQKISTIVF